MIDIRGEVSADRLGELSQVDVVIVACGFESRSRDLATQVGFTTARKWALAVPDTSAHAFEENCRTFHALGYSLQYLADDELEPWLRAELDEAVADRESGEMRMFVDISSLSRLRIAQILEGIERCSQSRAVRVFFGYSIAAFSPPALLPSPTVALGPVSSYFAGWATDPELPMSMIVGIGYEQDRAVGAVEFLEPSDVWAFIPTSSLSEYDVVLYQANATLLSQIDPKKQVRYPVEDPNATLALLLPLARKLSASSSVMLIPSGPKILVLLCMLVSCLYRSMSVWRASASHIEEPIDRCAAGRRIYFECLFHSSNGAAVGR